jgi:hypothetical protein
MNWCVWLPGTLLLVEVAVTDPPPASLDKSLAVRVTMWLCPESDDDV